MRKLLTLFILLSTTVALRAQTYVNQVIFLNEGYYDMQNQEQVHPVTIGSYNPSTQQYQEVAEIPGARFGSDLAISNGFLYVAADSELLKYDLNNFDLLATAIIPGIRHIAAGDGFLVVTRGEVNALPSYLQVRDPNNLSLIQDFGPQIGPAYSCEDVKIKGNKAYVAVSNSFVSGNYVGKLGTLDLSNMQYSEEDLGSNAKNPESVMLHNNDVYLLCNNDYTHSSIAWVEGGTAVQNSYAVALNASCGTSTIANAHIYYQEYGLDKLARFDVNTHSIADTLFNTQAYYTIGEDRVNQLLYATTTDYVNTGTAHVLDLNGNEISSFNVGVSPGTVAFDIRSTSGLHQPQLPQVSVYPNPTAGNITLSYGNQPKEVKLFDVTGKLVNSWKPSAQREQKNFSNLKAGIYLMKVQYATGSVSQRISVTQ